MMLASQNIVPGDFVLFLEDCFQSSGTVVAALHANHHTYNSSQHTQSLMNLGPMQYYVLPDGKDAIGGLVGPFWAEELIKVSETEASDPPGPIQ
jgi:hypothetical protein